MALPSLAALSQLTYLNLSETKVTAANLSSIRSMPNLRHIYLFNTPAQPAAHAADAAQPNTQEYAMNQNPEQ